MKRMKRLLASALSLVMLLTLLPAAVQAAPVNEELGEPPADQEPVSVYTAVQSPEARGNVVIDVVINETADAEVLDIPAIAQTTLNQWFQYWDDWEGSQMHPGQFVFFHLNVTNDSPYTYRYVPGSGRTAPVPFDFDEKNTLVYRTLNPALYELIRETELTLDDYNASGTMRACFEEFKKAMTVLDNDQTMETSDADTVANIDDCFRLSMMGDRSRSTASGAVESKWSSTEVKGSITWISMSHADLFVSDESVAAHLYKYYNLAADPATKDLTIPEIIETYLDQYYCTYYEVESLEDLTLPQLRSMFSGTPDGVDIKNEGDTYGPSESTYPDTYNLYFPETNEAVAKAGWTYMYSYLMTFGLWSDHSTITLKSFEGAAGHTMPHMKTPAILGNATTDAFPANPDYLDGALGSEEMLKSLAPGETAEAIFCVCKNGPHTRNCFDSPDFDFSFSFQMDREMPGALTVSKTVLGDDAPADQSFHFDLKLDAEPALTGTYGDLTIFNNEAAFILEDGGGLEMTGLPAGVSYEITEKPVQHYATAVEINGQPKDAAAGRIVGGETTDVVFLNSYKKPIPVQWDTSKSKTATRLNSDYESRVTLSLPSGEENLAADVVFVLDKSTSAELEDQALEMLSMLNRQIAGTGAEVKVGVVIFNKEAHASQWMDLATEYEAIEAAMRQEISSGTNTHAGMLAGKAMLDADAAVDADRKYLIFVSDGISYMFNAEPTAVAWSFDADGWKNWAGPDNWSCKYGSVAAPADWSAWMDAVDTQLKIQGSVYDYPYGGTPVMSTPQDETSKDYVMSIDKALYLTAETYEACEKLGYNCYAMSAGTSSAEANPWGPSFMEYLADGRDVTFDDIQNDIYYLLDAGSYVVDQIGYGKDDRGNAYNFDFVPSADALRLTVGGKVLPVTEVTELANCTCFAFGEPDGSKDGENYPFLLTYYPEGNPEYQDEFFFWSINVPISNFAPVQLTYTVKLTNPQEDTGEYRELYTNKQATLYPVDTNGIEGLPEDFERPEVSYEIEKEHHPSPLNRKDHYSYIIGYKDGTVRPYGTITRGEVATIFFRLLTDEARDMYWSQTNPFTDCSSDLWCNNAISTLYNMGQQTGVHIIDGFLDGTFQPYGRITRAQFAKIAVGFFEETAREYEGLYDDVEENAWYTSYIEAASRVGLIKGFEDGTFRPNVNITRAQACVIVNRALDRHPDEDRLLPYHEMVNWPDNNPGDWYYADIMEATNSHDYNWIPTNDFDEEGNRIRYERWTDKLPQRDWAAFEHAWSDAHSAPGGEVVKN